MICSVGCADTIEREARAAVKMLGSSILDSSEWKEGKRQLTFLGLVQIIRH